MTMKNNVLPKRMTAHLCRGANSPVVRCIWGVCQTPGYCWGHCILIPYQFNGIVLVQRYFIVSADSVHCIRIGIRGGRGGTTMSMIQNNDVLSPETCTNDLINSKSAQIICNVTSQFQVCRCYGPFICWGTFNTGASHESQRFILPTMRLFLKSLFWLTAHETSEN